MVLIFIRSINRVGDSDQLAIWCRSGSVLNWKLIEGYFISVVNASEEMLSDVTKMLSDMFENQ